MDYVAATVLFVFARVKRDHIAIKRLHLVKICGAYSHDDDGERLVRAPYDLVDRSLEIIDDAVSEDEANVVFLVELTDFRGLGDNLIVDESQDGGEPCWAVELDIDPCIIIRIQEPLKLVTFGVVNVPVEGETMRGGIGHSAVEPSTEPIGRKHLVGVVIFQNIHDGRNRSRVVILPGVVKSMQSTWHIDVTIGECEIDSDVQPNFTTTHEVVKKRHSGLSQKSYYRETGTILTLYRRVGRASFQLTQCCKALRNFPMRPTAVVLKHLDHYLVVVIIAA